jgi:DNA-binding NarL/FixJ family response regulator
MPKIAIIEDRPEISSGLDYIISQYPGYSCKVFMTAEAALNNITSGEFDVVLMDIQLPGMSGIECTQHLKQKFPELRIMMCTVFEDDEKIYRAIAAGASGYILKRTEPQILMKSINELMEGGAPISSSIAQKVLTAFRKLIPAEINNYQLTEREQEVLLLLAEGFRNKEVAVKLNVSAATVKSHVYNIYQKLHVTSKVEAINKFRSQPKG